MRPAVLVTSLSSMFGADSLPASKVNGIGADARANIESLEREWLSVQHPRPQNRRAKFEDLRVRVYGDTAIAIGIVANTDESGGDLRRTVFTDIFVRREGGWQAVNAQENAIMPGG